MVMLEIDVLGRLRVPEGKDIGKTVLILGFAWSPVD